MKKCVSYHMLKILVLPSGAGMEILTSLFSMVILAWSALSWYMLVCISTADSTNSGTFTPILVTNSTPMEGLNTSSFCSKKNTEDVHQTVRTARVFSPRRSLMFTTHIYPDCSKLQTENAHTIFGDRRRPPFAPGVKVPDRENVKGKPDAVGIMNRLSMKM